MIYVIKGFQKYVTYDKLWLEIEADSAEEALKFAKDSPDMCELTDCKCIAVDESEFIDFDQWKIVEEKESE